jgi:hypothetical protein
MKIIFRRAVVGNLFASAFVGCVILLYVNMRCIKTFATTCTWTNLHGVPLLRKHLVANLDQFFGSNCLPFPSTHVLVWLHLEYASSTWDPHLQKHIQQIEMVQRRAARFIKSNYSRDPGTVTTLLEQLELPPLSTRRKIACITLLHKAIHEKVAIPIPSFEWWNLEVLLGLMM